MFIYRRVIDDDFSPDEILFVRCCAKDLNPNGTLKPAAFHVPKQSTNRDKYSKAGDVLIPDKTEKSKAWIYWGVATLRVRDLPQGPEIAGNGAQFTFHVAHRPDPDNFSHSEFLALKNGQPTETVTDSVRKKVKTDLALRTRLHVTPLE
jgi:hypothetical protein